MVQMHRTRERVYMAGQTILPLESRQQMEDTHQILRVLEFPTSIQARALAAQTIQITIPISQAYFLSR